MSDRDADRPAALDRCAEPEPAGGSPDGFALAERHESSLLSLFELSNALGVLPGPYEIAQLALLNLMGHFGTSQAALWLLSDDGSNDAVPLRGFGVPDALLRALGSALERYAVEAFANSNAPIVLIDLPGEDRAPEAALAADAGLAVVAPAAVQGDRVGLLAVGRRMSGEPYQPIDLEHIAAAAGMVGVALQSARNYHRMQEANRELRQINDQLREADDLRAAFVRNVSHELRTPVAILVGYLAMLDATDLTPEQRKRVAVLEAQCQRLDLLMQNLLDFATYARERLSLQEEEGNVAPVLRDYAEARRPGILQAPREFAVTIAPALPRVRFDRRRLVQVVDALVDNAVKFTPVGSRIGLTAGVVPGDASSGVAIEVTDNGPGIERAHLATVFEPFRQIDGSMTRSAGGLGLGLALVKQIVERMGGTLEVESEVGVGTTFRVVLPGA